MRSQHSPPNAVLHVRFSPERSNLFESHWSNQWLTNVQLETERLRIDRAEFISALKNRGIGTSVHFIPLHLHPYYRDEFCYKPEDFPVASRTYERIISLPIYPSMSEQNVQRVVAAVPAVVEKNRR